MQTKVIILINPTQKELDLVKEHFTKEEPGLLNAEQLRFKLDQKGYRKPKSIVGLKSFCDKFNIKYEKTGKSYYFHNPEHLISLK